MTAVDILVIAPMTAVAAVQVGRQILDERRQAATALSRGGGGHAR